MGSFPAIVGNYNKGIGRIFNDYFMTNGRPTVDEPLTA